MPKIIREEEQLMFNFEQEATNQHVVEEKTALSFFAQSLLAARQNKQTIEIHDDETEEDIFAFLNQRIEQKNRRDEAEKLAIAANQRANKTMARLGH